MSQLSIKINSILRGKRFSDLNTEEWVAIGKLVKSGEMKGIAKLKGISPSEYADKPGLLVEASQELAQIFASASAGDILIALQFCEISTAVSVITPFNVIETLTNLKYNYVQKKSFNESEVPKTYVKEVDGKEISIEFPFDKPGLLFSKGRHYIGVPIEFDGIFNTRFIVGIPSTVCSFSPVKAKLTRTLCALFSYVGGKCKPVANNTVNKNLVSSTIIHGNITVLTALSSRLSDLVNATGVSTGDTLNGIEWLSVMYRALIATQVSDPSFGLICALLNKYIKGCDSKGMPCDFIILKGNIISLNFPKWAYPRSLDGVVLDAANGAITLRQAYFALELTRSVRMADLKERGAIPRTSYLTVPIAPTMADIVHLASQWDGLVPIDSDVVLTSLEDSPTQYIRAIEALLVNGHRGKITVTSAGIVTMLKKNGYGWSYKNKEIVVVGSGDVLMHMVPRGDEKRKPSLVIDMTSREPQFTSKNLVAFYDGVRQATEERVKYYNRYNIDFILRTSIYEQICELEVGSIKMSSAGHNLVAWVSSLGVNISQGILIANEKDLGKACTWSFMCNLARLIAPLTSVSVNQALKVIGQKLNFPGPKVDFTLPDNYVIHADAEFDLIDIAGIRNLSTEEYEDLVNSSNPAIQAILAENRPNATTSSSTSDINEEDVMILSEEDNSQY